MTTSPRMSNLHLDTSLASSSRPTRPSLSRNPSSASLRRSSPSNPFQPLPPQAALPYPPQSKLGSQRARRWLTRLIPPWIKRIMSRSSVLGITVILSLCLILYLSGRNLRPNVIPSGNSADPSSTPKLVSPGTPMNDQLLHTGPITLPNLPAEHYLEHFPILQLPDSILKLPLLAERLHSFLLRPITSHSSEAETYQQRFCPTLITDNLVNADQFRNEQEWWRDVDASEIAKRRAGMVKWLERRLALGETLVANENMQGRGIVLTGGNQVGNLPPREE